MLFALQRGIVDLAVRRELRIHGLGSRDIQGSGGLGGGVQKREQTGGHGFGGVQRLIPQHEFDGIGRTTKPDGRPESNQKFSATTLVTPRREARIIA